MMINTLPHTLKNSGRRNAVVQAFEACGRHVTVDELYECTRKIDPKVGYTTVWRTLKLLESEGLASPHKFHDGQTRYEFIKGEIHHDHLICVKCGRVEEFLNPAVEKLQRQVAKLHGFMMTNHKMELYGLCKRCKGEK